MVPRFSILGATLVLQVGVLAPNAVEQPGLDGVLATARVAGYLQDSKNARLELLARRAGSGEFFSRTAEVDGSGKFGFELPAGVYNFVVLRDGYAPILFIGQVLEPAKTRDLGTVSARRGSLVRVRVADARTARPIPKARVLWDPTPDQAGWRIWRDLMEKRWSGLTDADGRFSRADLPEVSARWRISATEHTEASTPAVRLESGKTYDLGRMPLSSGSRLKAELLLPPGIDAQTLSLALFEPDPNANYEFKQKTTGRPSARGVVTFESLRPGRYRLELRSPKATLTELEISVGETDDSIVVTVKEKKLTGCVRRDLHPVLEAEVTASTGRSEAVLGQTHTDRDGCYQLVLYQSGGGLVSVRAGKGGLSHSRSFDLTLDDQATVDFDLPSDKYHFAVRDAETGSSVGGATVRLRISNTERNANLPEGFAVIGRADSAGLFEIDDLPPGTGEVSVEAKGYRSTTLALPTSPPNGAPQEVALTKSVTWAGVVLNPQGSPVPGAKLMDASSRGFRYFVEADASGRFELVSPPDSPELFFAFAAGYALTPLQIALRERSDELIRLTLYPPQGAPIVVLKEDGTPMVNVQVAAGINGMRISPGAIERVARENGMEAKRLDGSLPDGSCLLPVFLAPGRYSFFVVSQPTPEHPQPNFFPIGEASVPLSSSVPLVAKRPR